LHDAWFGLIGVIGGALLALYCIKYDRFWEEFVGVEDGHTEYYDTDEYYQWEREKGNDV